MHQLKKSDWGLIEGKFVHTSESTSRFVYATVQIYCTLTVSFHPLVSLRRKIYKL